jgi:type I restriction enzyme S subunit
MARATFKDWFVDFGCTLAKLEGRAPYLAREMWALFPERLDESGVPDGWRTLTLGEVSNRITKGTTPASEDILSAPFPNRQVNFVRVNALTDTAQVIWEKLEHIPESVHLRSLKRSILIEEDILYSIAGTIGRVALVEKHLLPANTNQALAIIRPNKDLVPSRFLLMVLRQKVFEDALHANIVQAVQANLSLSMIAAAKCVLPPAERLSAMFTPVDSLIRKREENNHENQTLASLRDLLLRKLMSGEIRVKDAEKIVEAAQ